VITTLEEKKDLLSSLGIDHLIVYPFTKEFSKLPYPDFVRKILVEKIQTRYLVVGYDHRFGKNREGGFEYLTDCAKNYGFEIEKLDALLLNDINISSSKIRQALDNGSIETANNYLGYYFTLNGKVIEGRKLGRKIGFPTANIESSDIHKIIPGYGVYAVKIKIDNKVYKGMLNIGSRPTFNHNADNRSIEVNIFDFNKNIYGKYISLQFVKRIREEQKFNNPEDLITQLFKDQESAIRYLNS
ncbi:MAG: riboflavin biosynthesis protein RibF, partial [Mariniphaga sp.]|nr:riboflavin biosynthesis protein RibF [Mariniphaga sp.]